MKRITKQLLSIVSLLLFLAGSSFPEVYAETLNFQIAPIKIANSVNYETVHQSNGETNNIGSAPLLMPPHPKLWERYLKGEINLPKGMINPQGGFTEFDKMGSAINGVTGSVRALAVLVDFNDKVKTVQASFFDSLIFANPVLGRGSVRDYFNEISYGQIDIVTVNLPSDLGWIRANGDLSFYTNNNFCIYGTYPRNCRRLAEEIVDAVANSVNFSDYDNNHDGYAEPIMIVHAGRGTEYTGNPNDIWSHSWSLAIPRYLDGVFITDYVIMPEYMANVSATTSDMTIGVFAHEMGHGFWGLPDLYDTDYSSEGLGSWSLMAGGSWNGINGNGNSPAWPDAFSRIKMGILSPNEITENKSVTIHQAYDSGGPIFRFKNSTLNTNEYFLIENRQQVANSYDEFSPGSGLLIWHIDEAQSNNNNECKISPHSFCAGNHYLVALEQADGLRELENNIDGGDDGDPFPGSTNNRNWSFSTDPESSSWYSSNNACISVTGISDSGSDMNADVTIKCPIPSITNLDPDSKIAGDSGFTMIVDGTGFVTGSMVRWNGSNRTTTYISSSRLTASILTTDLVSAGSAEVSVYNPTPGGGASNLMDFTINGPTAVMVSYFTVSNQFNTVLLEWETANEVDLVGFNTYVSESLQGVKQKLNSNLLLAQNPGINVGAIYNFNDQVDQGKRYYFWLEIIAVNGTTFFEPVELTTKFISYLPLMMDHLSAAQNTILSLLVGISFTR